MPLETPAAVMTLPRSTTRSVGVVRAELLERTLAGPVRGRVDAVEDAGGGQVDRTGADARRPRRRRVHGAQPLDELGLELGVVEAAGHDDDVGGRDVGERLRRDEPGPAGVVDDRTGLGGHEHDVVAGHVGEDLERAR